MAIKFEVKTPPPAAAKPLPEKKPAPAVSPPTDVSPPPPEPPRAKRKPAKAPVDPQDDLLAKR